MNLLDPASCFTNTTHSCAGLGSSNRPLTSNGSLAFGSNSTHKTSQRWERTDPVNRFTSQGSISSFAALLHRDLAWLGLLA